MGRWTKRFLSYLLALAMVATSLSLPMNSPVAAAAAESTKVEASSGVTDLVGVKVDEEKVLQEMQLYLNGVYEAKISLEEGTHKLQVINNGSKVGDEKTVTLNKAQSVYIRVQDGNVYDSINNEDEFQYAAIVGNFEGLEFLDEAGQSYQIASWTPEDKNARMEYLGGGIYKKTVTVKALTEDLTLKDGGYKIAFNGKWDKEINDGGSNIALTIPAKTKEITFFADAISSKAYTSVQSNAYTISQDSGEKTYPAFGMSVSLIGTVRGDEDANWTLSATGYEFTQISDQLFLYQADLAAGSYEYKAAFNYDTWYQKTNNKALTVTGDTTHVVFLYDASEEGLYDSVSDEAVIADKLGMKSIPAESSVTTNANGTTKFVTTVANNDSDSVQLVYAAKNTPKDTKMITLQKGVNGSGKFNGTFVTSDVFFGDDAVDLLYYYEVNGKRVVDPTTTQVTVEGEVYSSYQRDAFTGRLVNVPGTFSDPNWDAASNPMAYKGDGLYEYTFKDVIAGNYEFKISMGTWDENYGQEGKAGGANYQVAVPNKQDVTVYYNDITTHYAVTTVNYIIANITLSGTNIPEKTTFSDPGLAGIYNCTVTLPKGEYTDIKMTYEDEQYAMEPFTLEQEKAVTFYFDPSTDIYYNDSNAAQIDASKVYFDSKDTTYKSVFGAAEEGENVTYTLQTGTDVTKVKLIVKGTKNTTVDFTQEVKSDKAYWSGKLKLDTYGQYKYFFVVYYGSSLKIYCDDDGNYGTGMLTDLTSLKPYDLTIYKKGYKTPDWMKNAVIYQIFPDRFCNGDTANDDAQTTSRGATNYEFITNWNTIPENPDQEKINPDTYPENAYKGDGVFSNEIYGGDLQGIIKRMDYLKAVGVTVIYLNPVFSSISTHRYDTTDYTKIDPILGTLGDFEELVKAAKKNNMHIVLDGVFNHVSDDSVYFDRYYKFVGQNGKVGAYPYWAYVYDYMKEHKASKEDAEKAAKSYFKTRGVKDFSYTEWFEVYSDTMLLGDDKNVVKDTIGERKGKDVYGYEGWWGYDSMPVVKSTEGSEYQTGNWASTVIEGSKSIGQYWLKKGMNGWRLDVANEVSDETWQHFRNSVKALNEDNVVIGEIWTDATKYLLGDMYDSVMNYVFRDAALAYAKGGNAQDTINSLENLRERYPKEAFYAMMNLVGSHDTSRVLSSLDGIADDRADTTIAGAFPSYETTSNEAKQKQYVVALLQMTYAGAPTIYYGDEIGMVGADDPDDRRAMAWGEGNKDIVEWYAYLAKMRSEYPALQTGDIKSFSLNTSVLGYVRSDKNDQLVVLMNNTGNDQTITFDVDDKITRTTNTLYDVIKGQSYTVDEKGNVEVTIPAYRGIVLTENKKEITIDADALKPAYDASYKVSSRYEGVSLNKKKETMFTGTTLTLTATMDPKDTADIKGMAWTSSNENVATVKDGLVTAVAKGTAIITVTLGGKSAECTITVTEKKIKVAQVKGVKASGVTATTITLKWNQVIGATGYEVYKKNGSAWSKIADTNKTSMTDTKLTPSAKYQYRVRAYHASDKTKTYGAYSEVVTVKTATSILPLKVTGVKVKALSTSKVKISWNKGKNASGYVIYRKKNDGSYKKIKTLNKGSFTTYVVSGLKEGNSYTFRICAYIKGRTGTMYGDWSDTASIRMEVSAPGKLRAYQVSKTKIKVAWNKGTGRSGYQITMSTNNGPYKISKTIKKGSSTSTIVSGLKKGNTYRFQIRAYKVVDGKYYYSKTVTSNKQKMR